MGQPKRRVVAIERRIPYDPLPSQARFHGSDKRFKGFSGPIGSGKSAALCNEAIKLAYLNPGRVGLMGAPTYPMLRDATQTALLEILQASGIPYDLNKAENYLVFRDTGSKILFRSLDDFERLRGTNLAWFGVDELTYTTEEAWIRLEGRLRDPKAKQWCGFAVWTPKGYDWVYRRFIADPVQGYECVIAAAFENRHLLKQIPDYYERLKHSYDKAFYEQEVLGSYLNFQSGLVYHSFDRKVNISPVSVNPQSRLFWAMDFNVDPMSSVVVQIDRGVVKVIDEIVLSRACTWDACAEFHRRYRGFTAGVTILGDCSANHSVSTGQVLTSHQELIRQYFHEKNWNNISLRFERTNPLVRDRVGLVNAKLRSAEGESTLFVDPQCKELIADFERVAYRSGTAEIDKTSDPKRTHLSDALGYLIWTEFRPARRVGEQSRRLL